MAKTHSRVIAALSSDRMDRYLVEAGGNEKRALELYRWHGELTGAVQFVLGVVEVVLRNAIDAQLQAWNSVKKPGATSWLLEEPAEPLAKLTKKKRESANHRAELEASRRDPSHRRYGATVTHNDVLTQAMFGLWSQLLPSHIEGARDSQVNRSRDELWEECTQKAFPHIEDPTGRVTAKRVANLVALRNRVSHMESLLDTNIQSLMRDAFALVSSIDPPVAAWLTGTSQVASIIKKRPKGITGDKVL